MAATGGKTGTKIRPGREAIILRRMLARHQGALPRQAIIRIWRELFGAALIIEGGQTMAVCDGEGGEARLALAREHFGPLTPMRRHANPAQTLADLTREGGAQLAVLPPLAEDDEAHGGWWPMLTATGPHRLYVIAQDPLLDQAGRGPAPGRRLCGGRRAARPSGDDRGLIALQLNADISRARIIALVREAGFEPGALWVRRLPGDPRMHALVEVEGLVDDADPRLGAIAGLDAPPVVVGGFAVPLGENA